MFYLDLPCLPTNTTDSNKNLIDVISKENVLTFFELRQKSYVPQKHISQNVYLQNENFNIFAVSITDNLAKQLVFRK